MNNIILIGMPGVGKSTVGVVLAKTLGYAFLDSDLLIQEREALGTVVYLKLSYEELTERLGDLNKRGVSIRPGETLETLYEERIPIYERYADVTVDCEDLSIRDIVKKITYLF